jgi:hypothetical protein
MSEHAWARQGMRASALVLIVALLVSGLGPDVAGTVSAGDRVGKAEIQSFVGGSIAIPDFAVASPYPSTIAVSGFETPVANVAITINQFSHGDPEQADMLLVGPDGQTAIFWSDLGGLNDAINVTLTFDDHAPNQIFPGPALPLSGTFQPSNGNTTGLDNFPPPAPSPLASGAQLGVFNGTDPNGTWQLFVMDQGAGQTGSIGSWSLRITSANGVPTASPESFQAQAGKPLIVPAAGVLGNDSDPDGDLLQAIVAGQPRQGSLSLQADGGFTYTPKKKAKGADSFTYLAQDPSGLSDLETVSIQIKAKKKKKGRK